MTQDQTRTVRIRCSTWDQVESFHQKKLKGSALVLKLPFQPTPGDALTVALGLPSGLVFAIDGKAAKVAKNATGGKYPVAIDLHGLTGELRDRLRELIDEARADGVKQRATTAKPDIKPAAKTQERIAGHGQTQSQSQGQGRCPRPCGAAQVASARGQEGKEQASYSAVHAASTETGRASHAQRTGHVAPATVAERRARCTWHRQQRRAGCDRNAYFRLAKKHHPDVLGLYRSPRVGRAASEVFIHVNKAYDRLRAAAMAAEGIDAAGPALRATPGWVIDIEDVQTIDENDGVGDLAKGSDMLDVSGDDTRELDLPQETGPIGSARQALQKGQWSAAREHLVEALGGDPRNRGLRALFHVASGMQLREHGRVTESRLHFETALAHDSECVEAQRALTLEHEGADRESVLRRIFQR